MRTISRFVLLLAALTVSMAHAADATAPQHATLAVDGMTCPTCPITVKKSLQAIPGVTKVKVDYSTKQAVVEYDPKRTTPQALMQATTDAGYPSHIKSN